MSFIAVCRLAHTSFSFKLWIFTWMSLRGIENEAELTISQDLLFAWLEQFSSHADADLRANSIQLADFLHHSIVRHQKRWFFPGRSGHMTLDQKSTSLLESVNQTMKISSSNKVRAAMSLLTSFRTQNDQVALRMRELNLNVQRDFHATSLWACSPTASHLTTVAESWNQQQLEQSKNYASFVVHNGLIKIRRLPKKPIACDKCRVGDRYVCPEHSEQSPIPHFDRVRHLEVMPTEIPDRWMLKCSCLFHPTTGVPCRHVRCVLRRVHPSHVHVRWHKRYFANYGHQGHEGDTTKFKQLCNDHRLLIDRQDYGLIMVAAQKNQQDYGLPQSFFEISTCINQASPRGIVPLEANDENDRCYSVQVDNDLYARGQFSQQKGFAEGSRDDNTQAVIHPCREIRQSSDLYQTCKSHYEHFCAISENIEGAEAIVREGLADVAAKLSTLAIQKTCKSSSFDAPIVSSHLPVNRHKKYVRKKHPAEPQCKRLKESKSTTATLQESIVTFFN